MVASRAGKPVVVEQLIAKGANVNARGARSQTALMWAVSQKHPEVVQGAARARRRRARAIGQMEPGDGRASARLSPVQQGYPAGSETALMFAARVGDLDSARLLVAAGAHVNDADAWGVSATSLAAHSDYRGLVEFLLEKGADPNAAAPGFTALHEAIMHRDERMVGALLAHGADANAPLRTWTPMRRSARDFNFAPELVGATPFWLAARFTEPGVMRLLVEHGADTRFVHHSEKVVEGRAGEGFQHRLEATTALMAATGMGGGSEAWVPLERGQREALTLAAVKLAVELGIDVNAANTDGRTALDAAKTLKFETVVAFLVERGAKPGTKKGPALPAARDKDDPREPQ